MNSPGANDRQAGRQRLGALALAATGAFFIWRSLAALPLGTIDNPGPAAMPLALAVLLVVFALWSLGGASSGLLDPAAADDNDAPDADGDGVRHAALVIAALLAAAVALDRLGYRLTILCLLLFFLGLVERKPIVTALVVSATLSLGSHALFVHVLKIPLPSGPMGI
jgi:Tripartite tricarboxylate transporter TctB family